MLGGADNPNGELLSYIIGADNELAEELQNSIQVRFETESETGT